MNIFETDDYRRFLRSFIAKLPKKGRGEINRLAQFSKVHPSLISQVLNGLKDLSLEQAQLVCEYLDLTNQETEYFLTLVQFQRAGTAKLRKYYKQKLMDIREKSLEISQHVRHDRDLTEEEKSIFYSHWLYAAIWLLTSLPNGRSLDEVSHHFEINRERATEILHFLADTHLCLVENGRYKMGPQSIHLPRGSVHLTKHHTNWRLRAIEASDNIAQEELMYTAPLSVSRSDFNKIRNRLAEIIKEVTDQAIGSEAEAIACFNMDFFWVRK